MSIVINRLHSGDVCLQQCYIDRQIDIVYFSDMYITTNTWEHEILLNEVPSPRGLISHYTYIIYTKVQYKLEKK